MCSDIFVVFERAELREFKTQTCRAHQFDSYSDLDYIRDVLMTWNMRNLIIHIHVYMVHIQVSTQQLNTVWFTVAWPPLPHVQASVCACWSSSAVMFSIFPGFTCHTILVSIRILPHHPFSPQPWSGFFFFFSFVTPSCLYFVVVRNPSLTPAVYTIKLTFIYVALFFLTRLQGALERKKQTADEAAQIKRNK